MDAADTGIGYLSDFNGARRHQLHGTLNAHQMLEGRTYRMVHHDVASVYQLPSLFIMGGGFFCTPRAYLRQIILHAKSLYATENNLPLQICHKLGQLSKQNHEEKARIFGKRRFSA